MGAQLEQIDGAFGTRPVVCRTMDFRSNEFRGLTGGERFESVEQNPMIGYCGCYRYVKDPETFALELETLGRVREECGTASCRSRSTPRPSRPLDGYSRPPSAACCSTQREPERVRISPRRRVCHTGAVQPLGSITSRSTPTRSPSPRRLRVATETHFPIRCRPPAPSRSSTTPPTCAGCGRSSRCWSTGPEHRILDSVQRIEQCGDRVTNVAVPGIHVPSHPHRLTEGTS